MSASGPSGPLVYHIGDLSQILLEGNCNHIQLETRELTLEHTVIYATAI